jgi:alpha-beta hydrolase superfamily lysophospholipase
MKKYLIIVLLALLLIAGCGSDEPTEDIDYLTTQDGVKIAYNFHQGEDHGVILLHQTGGDRHTYRTLYETLANEGRSVITIDFRGHGESDLDYNAFTEQDWNSLRLDVKAARDFLAEQGVYKVAIVGSSIGANIALKYAVEDGKILSLILISPGEEYNGVKTLPYTEHFQRPVLVIAGKEDEYASTSATRIYNALEGIKDLKLYPTEQHGTNLLAFENTYQDISYWLNEYGNAK